MYADEELLATLSRATAETLLAELREQHRDSGRTVDQTLAAIEARLQAISEQAKQDAIKDRFTIAKAEREAGGVGAERRFDQALKEIDVVSAAWDESVRGAFAQSVREWEETGEPVLGSGGWVVVSVTAYQPGSIWWTDAPRIAGWRTTIAREVFFSVTRDDRARSGDPLELARLSDYSVGGAIRSSADTMLADFQDQQRYDATRFGAHPAQAQAAAGQIAALREPWIAGCHTEMLEMLRYWAGGGTG